MAHAKSLCTPELYDWISQGERLTPIKVYKAPISRWRRYERLARRPQGLVPLGDALAHVNPIFGQGMTLASAHAIGLMDILAERAASGEGLHGVAGPYLERTHDFTQTVWGSLEAVELSFACTKGERPADLEMRLSFSRALRRLSEEDAEVENIMYRVGQLLLPPSALRRPDITDRVVRIMRVGGA